MASPPLSIKTVLKRFLEDQGARLSPRTFRDYDYAIQLLEDCLNRCGPDRLTKAESAHYARLSEPPSGRPREFCEIFGPEHILPHLNEFLGWFMVRKVVAGEELLRTAGTATRKLAAWLADQGHVSRRDADRGVDRGRRASRALVDGRKLAAWLQELGEEDETDPDGPEVEDHFDVTKVSGGRIWLEGLSSGLVVGPLPLPPELVDSCRVGWSVSGLVAGRGRNARFYEVGNVYPT